MKKTIKVELPGVGAVPASQAIIDVDATTIKPKEDRTKKVSRVYSSVTLGQGGLGGGKPWWHLEAEGWGVG